MKPSLLIRADASPQIGIGHVMRSLALAGAWRRAGEPVLLASVALPAGLRERALRIGVVCLALEASPGSAEDAQSIRHILASQAITHLVVDGYCFGTDYIRHLREDVGSILVLDDCGHLASAPWDFVLNASPGSSRLDYPASRPGGRQLLGPRYALLQSAFLEAARRPVSAPQPGAAGAAEHVLIVMGGSDPARISSKALRAVASLTPKLPHVTLVIGGANPDREALEAQARGMGARVVADAIHMPELMQEADLAISAGGSTLWELCYMGVPTLAVVTAENQSRLVQSLEERGVLASAGWHADLTPESLAAQLALLIQGPERRSAMGRGGQRLVDGFGAFRVWMHLRASRIELRGGADSDSARVFEWANDPVTRKASFVSEPIAWDDHQAWFRACLASTAIRLWIAEEEGRAIGVVRFEEDWPSVVVSINVSPDHRGSGRGALILWNACRKWFAESASECVVARIRPENTSSIAVFEKVGFERTGMGEVKGGAALRYELRRSDFE